ncbi:putative ABC transporter permease [Clostridioides mangenotii]|uniref:putative ABC transporter permease n=1 Tax=Metaclostridioides mangenotii TaxID=1540 RepID=UPI001C0F554B|nr:putative ABC transporter permease [Clostridioides mangenotii]MBU5307633.1 putative ABC transporter permease [Clostridioides mangenotii]MCR1955008.1 putative ABC transporter permease [Clostridioides mangenotii]
MIIRFLIYGALGWCMEILWTGFHSLKDKDYKMTATTSIWMFFIYGMVVFFEPVCDLLAGLPIIIRGGVYVLCIFGIEYLTGGFLRRLGTCPWDYTGSRFSINGLIRLDYAPAWFLAGIIFETVYRQLI